MGTIGLRNPGLTVIGTAIGAVASGASQFVDWQFPLAVERAKFKSLEIQEPSVTLAACR